MVVVVAVEVEATAVFANFVIVLAMLYQNVITVLTLIFRLLHPTHLCQVRILFQDNKHLAKVSMHSIRHHQMTLKMITPGI